MDMIFHGWSTRRFQAKQQWSRIRPHGSLGYRSPAPEATTPPLPPSGSASLHLQPAMALEVDVPPHFSARLKVSFPAL
jgi:hypothetical protein